MISSSHSRLSYRDRRSHQKQRFLLLGVFLLLALLYQGGLLLAASYRVESVSMQPTLPPGTRLMVRPYLFGGGLRKGPLPLERGDLVVIRPPSYQEPPWYIKILDPFVRFLSLQKLSLGSSSSRGWNNPLILKRVIGFPGDRVHMKDSVAYVHPPGEDFPLTEFETSGIPYDIIGVELPEGWQRSYPLSGNQEEILLQPGELYVLGDNRGFSQDSRYTGPLPEEQVQGKVFFIYWPFSRFGRPF